MAVDGPLCSHIRWIQCGGTTAHLVIISAVDALGVKEAVPGLDEEASEALDDASSDVDPGA